MKHKMGEISLFVRSMGKLLAVTGIFDDVDQANKHMEKTNDAVVAELPSGLILLADKGDQGVKLPPEQPRGLLVKNGKFVARPGFKLVPCERCKTWQSAWPHCEGWEEVPEEPPKVYYRPMPGPGEVRTAKQTRFDVVSKAGSVRKYLVSRKDGDERSPGSTWLLNTVDPFEYVGKLDPGSGELLHTERSRYPESDPIFAVARVALAIIYGRRDCPDGFEIRGAKLQPPKLPDDVSRETAG